MIFVNDHFWFLALCHFAKLLIKKLVSKKFFFEIFWLRDSTGKLFPSKIDHINQFQNKKRNYILNENGIDILLIGLISFILNYWNKVRILLLTDLAFFDLPIRLGLIQIRKKCWNFSGLACQWSLKDLYQRVETILQEFAPHYIPHIKKGGVAIVRLNWGSFGNFLLNSYLFICKLSKPLRVNLKKPCYFWLENWMEVTYLGLGHITL